MNRNCRKELDVRYTLQQRAIKEVCEELDLIVFYPNYHADKQDDNTVLIYTKEDHEYNKNLPYWASYKEFKNYICHFVNTDINGRFDLDWMNNGAIDCRGINEKEKIKSYLENRLIEYLRKDLNKTALRFNLVIKEEI